MTTWILLIVLTTGTGAITTTQLGPYDNEGQCNQVKAVVDHAIPAVRRLPGDWEITSKTLVCTRGRNI